MNQHFHRVGEMLLGQKLEEIPCRPAVGTDGVVLGMNGARLGADQGQDEMALNWPN